VQDSSESAGGNLFETYDVTWTTIMPLQL